MHWCPRQTPKSGFFPAHSSTAGKLTPARSGSQGPGGKHEPMVFVYGDLPEGFRIISQDFALRSEFAEVLYQIVGKGIVIVYDEQRIFALSTFVVLLPESFLEPQRVEADESTRILRFVIAFIVVHGGNALVVKEYSDFRPTVVMPPL